MAARDGSSADGGTAPVVAAFCRQRGLVGRGRAGQGARDGAAGDREAAGRSRRGSSTTPRSPSKASIRSACTTNIAVSSASRPIARWRCRCRLPIMPPAFRWPIGCTCRKPGRRIAPGGRRQACRSRSSSRPSRRSRWSRSAGPARAGLPRGVALMDAAYGRDARLRAGMTELGVPYVVGIVPTILMWAPGSGPRRMDKPMNNTGRRDEPELVSAKKVALGLPKQAWRTVTWREGSADRLSSRFARVRVRVGYNKLIPEKLSPEWLLIEWPEGEAEPTKYWLSTLPENVSFDAARRSGQAALAHRARLSGAQAGGRARSLRRARLAWLPSSRNAVHRGLRLPDRRTGDDSPSGPRSAAPVQVACLTRQLSTQRIRPCGLNATSRTRSQPCARG